MESEAQKALGDLLDGLVQGIVDTANQNQDVAPTNYLVFSRSEPEPWHVTFFYKDNAAMRVALSTGCAYDLHNFTHKNLGNVVELSELEFYVWFESVDGFDLEDVAEYRERLSQKLVGMALRETDGVCNVCGHDAGTHKLVGPTDEKLGVPTSGWMICPDEHCNCFRTWDAALSDQK